jgi:hypothetical protein
MDVGAVLDHPPRRGEPCLTRRHAARRDPRKRPVVALAERSAVELRVVRHEMLDLLQVLGLDGQLELLGKVRVLGELASGFFGVGRHDNLLSENSANCGAEDNYARRPKESYGAVRLSGWQSCTNRNESGFKVMVNYPHPMRSLWRLAPAELRCGKRFNPGPAGRSRAGARVDRRPARTS